jgi:hypothetical protein
VGRAPPSVPTLRRFWNRLALVGGWTYCRVVWTRRATATKFLPHGMFALLLSSAPAVAQELESPHSATAAMPSPSESPLSLELTRDDSAAACPDLPWFREHVAAHAGASGQAGKFKLWLAHNPDGWHALIQRWEPGAETEPAAERKLSDRSTACQPLAEAVAITIAILADDYAQHRPTPSQEAAPAPAAPVQPPPDVPPSAAPRHSSLRAWVGAGGGAAVSWISPAAPVLGFSVSLDSPYLRQSMRVMLTTEQKFDLDPGRVVVQAWLATLLSCARFAGKSVGTALCAAFDASMLRASAQGFSDATSSSRPYEAVGVELQPSWMITQSYGITAVLGVLLPFTQESFSVTGRGVAYLPPPLNWRVLLFSELGAF